MNHHDLVAACQSEWQGYTEHEFVKSLALGSLAQRHYQHYLQQDFLFLKHYARAFALAIYKSNDLAEMRDSLPVLHGLLDQEIQHHVDYCGQWGLTEADMEAEPEDFGTVAYTRYVLDCGMQGDLVELFVALAPCSIGYGVIGEALLAESAQQAGTTVLEGNPYRSWIEMYGGDDFQHGVEITRQRLDRLLADIPLTSARGQRLIEVFRTATRMEIAFWQQGLNA
ncbi:TenA family protein [Thaumasiovibrio subtropicus]|uniref:TenA family protein n=1 Tax=Thaumasiovibrio subtropicus TaxID=1891207 RepID=UPI000B34CE23|nr:TenA family protein [Thaumasiovibrio subtropicus]